MQQRVRFQMMLLISVAVIAVLAFENVAVAPGQLDSGSQSEPVGASVRHLIPEEPREASAERLREPVLPVCKLEDSAGIGPCPKTHSPVVRQGLDSSGQPTWWHADGSMTVRVKQGYTALDGQRQLIPRIVVVRPAPSASVPKK